MKGLPPLRRISVNIIDQLNTSFIVALNTVESYIAVPRQTQKRSSSNLYLKIYKALLPQEPVLSSDLFRRDLASWVLDLFDAAPELCSNTGRPGHWPSSVSLGLHKKFKSFKNTQIR